MFFYARWRWFWYIYCQKIKIIVKIKILTIDCFCITVFSTLFYNCICFTLWYFRTYIYIYEKWILILKIFPIQKFVNKMKINNIFNWQIKRKNETKIHTRTISQFLWKKWKNKNKIYVHLGIIIMILAKMIVHFSIRFSVQFSLVRLFTFDNSLVLILFSFFNYG